MRKLIHSSSDRFCLFTHKKKIYPIFRLCPFLHRQMCLSLSLSLYLPLYLNIQVRIKVRNLRRNNLADKSLLAPCTMF